MFHFRGPSHIGDRLVLKAIVNNAFKNRWVSATRRALTIRETVLLHLVCVCPVHSYLNPSTCVCVFIPSCTHVLSCSMEVGVCAEAYQGGEPLRHINSAFMTFEVLDGDRKPRTLPRLRPEPVVSPPLTCWEFMVCNKGPRQRWKKQFITVFTLLSQVGDISIMCCFVSQDGKRRYQEAIARKKIRLDRLVFLLKASSS